MNLTSLIIISGLLWLPNCSNKYYVKKYNKAREQLIARGVPLLQDTISAPRSLTFEGWKMDTSMLARPAAPVVIQGKNGGSVTIINRDEFPVNLEIEINNPDTVIQWEDRIIRDPYPVYVEPTLKELVRRYKWTLIIGGLVLVVILLLFNRPRITF